MRILKQVDGESPLGKSRFPKPSLPGYSPFLPLLLIFLVLNLTTARDCYDLYRHIHVVRATNRTMKARLEQTGEKVAFIEKLKAGLTKAAPTDPVAANILQVFFPPKPGPAPVGGG